VNVFICWSGPASHKLAEGLREWLPCVIQALKPFLSSEDISKGQRWIAELNQQLEETNYGVLCMTPENLQAPWVHFEAGALSKHSQASRVSALLLSIKPSDLNSPLGQFHHTEPTRADMLKLVKSINQAMEQGRSISESVLNASFEAHWSYFEKVIAEAREVLKRDKQETPSPRTTTEMFEEIIVRLREIQRESSSTLERATRAEIQQLYASPEIQAMLDRLRLTQLIGGNTLNLGQAAGSGFVRAGAALLTEGPDTVRADGAVTNKPKGRLPDQ
jgi:hypothetical protein